MKQRRIIGHREVYVSLDSETSDDCADMGMNLRRFTRTVPIYARAKKKPAKKLKAVKP